MPGRVATRSQPIGRVVGLFRYPVKSMGGESLKATDVGERGLPGDRGWALRGQDGRPLSAKRLAALMRASARYEREPAAGLIPDARIALPGGNVVRTSDPETSRRLSDWLGQALTLAAAEGRHFDAHPIHLLTTASLASMRRRAPSSLWDVRRFRPNILVEPLDAREDFPELAWAGELRVGRARLLFKKPCRRCVMTTHPQDGLPEDSRVLRELVDHAGAALGVYASVLKPGRVAVGDLVARAP